MYKIISFPTENIIALFYICGEIEQDFHKRLEAGLDMFYLVRMLAKKCVFLENDTMELALIRYCLATSILDRGINELKLAEMKHTSSKLGHSDLVHLIENLEEDMP